MARRFGGLGAVVASVLLFSGCALLYQDPTVHIVDVQVRSLGMTSGTADVELEVENPNRFGLEVQGFRYRLELEEPGSDDTWVQLARGSSDESIALPRRKTERVTVTVPFEYDGMGTAIRSILQGGVIRYRFTGDIQARGLAREVDFPFEARGALDI